MSGKLPIDRVREAENAPKLIEREKKRYARKQAKLRDEAERAAPAAEKQKESGNA